MATEGEETVLKEEVEENAGEQATVEITVEVSTEPEDLKEVWINIFVQISTITTNFD